MTFYRAATISVVKLAGDVYENSSSPELESHQLEKNREMNLKESARRKQARSGQEGSEKGE